MTMKKLLSLIRKTVIKTQTHPFLGTLYKSSYRWSLHIFLRHIFEAEPICTVYSRNSYACGTYKPGMSDIDLIVIYQDSLTTINLWRCLRRIVRLFYFYHHLFPMIDQFPIYTKKDFQLAWKYGVVQEETYAWCLEHGEEDIINSDQFLDRGFQPNEIMTIALGTFFNSFHQNYHNYCRGLQKENEMFRSANKTIRILKNIAQHADLKIESSKSSDTLMARLLFQLDRIQTTLFSADVFPEHRFTVLRQKKNNAVFLPETDLLHDMLPNIFGIVRESLHEGRIFIILKSTDFKSLQNTVLFVQKIYKEVLHQTFFLTYPLWSSLLRHKKPLLYYRLQKERYIMFGRDILDGILSPSIHGIRSFFRCEADALLKAPLSIWLSKKDLNINNLNILLGQMLKRLIRICFFLEQKIFLLDIDPVKYQDKLSNFKTIVKTIHHSVQDQNQFDMFKTMIEIKNILYQYLITYNWLFDDSDSYDKSLLKFGN